MPGVFQLPHQILTHADRSVGRKDIMADRRLGLGGHVADVIQDLDDLGRELYGFSRH